MNDRCNCHAEGLATFVLGALVGVAVGVLLAPAKGETTRRKLKRWAEDAYEDGVEELSGRAREIKERVMDRTEALKGKFSDAKDAMQERAGELKERFSAKAEEYKHRALEKTEDLRGKAADELEKAAKKIR